MFTGIIQEVGTISRVKNLQGGKELTIACEFSDQLQVDQSISINGVCHTVTAFDENSFTVQSVEETLRKTNIGHLKQDDLVNLERSLRPDQLLDGHLVQGHVDAVGTVEKIEQEGTDYLFTISYPDEYQYCRARKYSFGWYLPWQMKKIANLPLPLFPIPIIIRT